MFMAHGATDPDYQYGCETTGPAKQEQGPLPWEENMHIALCPASLDLLLLEEYPAAICGGALRAAMLR